MELRYISVPLLIAAARGDPWQVDASSQSGCAAMFCGTTFLAPNR
ncbi:putative alpha/beta hydrolase [Mycobacterium noviomagense]